MDIFGKRPPSPGPGPGARLKLGLRGTAKQPQHRGRQKANVKLMMLFEDTKMYAKVRGRSGAYPCNPVSRDAEHRKATVVWGHHINLELACACLILDQLCDQTVWSAWCCNTAHYPFACIPRGHCLPAPGLGWFVWQNDMFPVTVNFQPDLIFSFGPCDGVLAV